MFYVSPIVTTKNISIEDTEKKMRKESKHVITTTKRKEESKRGKREQKCYKTQKTRNRMAVLSSSLSVSTFNANGSLQVTTADIIFESSILIRTSL